MKDIKGKDIHIGDLVVLTERVSRYGRHELRTGHVVALEVNELPSGVQERVRIREESSRRLSAGTCGALEIEEYRHLRKPGEVLVILRGA